jgi:hypothetical protein
MTIVELMTRPREMLLRTSAGQNDCAIDRALAIFVGPPSAQTGLNAPFFTGDEVGAVDGSMSWLIAFDIVNIRNNVVRAYCPEVSTIRKRASPLIIRS